MSLPTPRDREAERQRELLCALCGRGDAPVAERAGLAGCVGWVGLAGRQDRELAPGAGLGAYRANAHAMARRALAAAYPTVRQLLGDESFAALASALWRARPPLRGDLAWFGEGLAEWLEATASLADEAYLPDVARLEWAVHRAGLAADHDAPVAGLVLLGEFEPELLRVRFVPGTALLASPYPVLAIWQAHRAEGDEGIGAGPQALAHAREALAAGRRDHAWVWRRGWRVEVGLLAAGEAAFMQSLVAGASLGRALAAWPVSTTTGGARFGFEAWLLRALREGWLAGFDLRDEGATGAAGGDPLDEAGA